MRRAALIGISIFMIVVGVGAWPPSLGAQNPPAAVGTGLIAGQVLDVPSGKPIPEATVSIQGRAGPQPGRGGLPAPSPVLTDSQGRFFFAGLRAGLYALFASKPGHLVTLGGTPPNVELGDSARVLDVVIRLEKVASVSGTLRDEAGDPVVGTDVLLFRRFTFNGRPSFAQYSRKRSDDRGAFRADSLQSGEYVICACGRDPIPFDGLLLTTLASEPAQLMNVAARALSAGSDVAAIDSTLRTPAPTLYPDSQSLARATRVTIAPGDDRTGIDITLPLSRATRVSGTIVGAPAPLQASMVRLVPEIDAESGIELFSYSPMLVQPDGRFDFTQVPPGQYRLSVVARDIAGLPAGPSGAAMAFIGSRGVMPPTPQPPGASAGPASLAPLLWASESIGVGDNGVSGLVVTLKRGVSVSGRAELVERAAGTPRLQARMAFLLEPLGFERQSLQAQPIALMSPDGTFSVPGVIPGRFSLLPTPPPGFTALKSIAVAGVDITDLPLEVGERDIRDLVITFTDAPMASLAVSVVPGGASARRSDRLSAVVFPVDQKFWTDPYVARRRIRSAGLSATGAATIADLPAGDYYLLVTAAEEALEWQDRARIEAWARQAQRITLADGEKKTVEVRR